MTLLMTSDNTSSCSFAFIQSIDKRKLFFEYKQVLLYIMDKLSSAIIGGSVLDMKYVFNTTVTELQIKYPLAIKLMKWLITIPVSEAICESWGSVITNIMTKRPGANDGSYEDVGTTDMLAYIQINGPPSGYKNNRRFLKLALLQRYGNQYYNHFKPVSNNKILSEVVTSKVIQRIQNDLNASLPCFV